MAPSYVSGIASPDSAHVLPQRGGVFRASFLTGVLFKKERGPGVCYQGIDPSFDLYIHISRTRIDPVGRQDD